MLRSGLVLCWTIWCSLSVQAQWVPVGPFGGVINSGLTQGNTLLVGTQSGIFRSTDGGLTFSAQSKGIPSGTIVDLYAEGGFIFACIFEKGIYRSADNGVTWTLVLPGRYLRQDSFGQSKIQKVGNHLMVRNYDDFNDSLFFTSDAGATWTRRAINSSLFNNVNTFGSSLFSYNSANRWGPQAGLYRSDDLGQNWVFSGAGLPAEQFVGQMLAYGDTLYALASHIFRSLDGGANWTQVTTATLPTVGGSFDFAPEWVIKVGRTIFAQNGGNFNVKTVTWTPGQSSWQDSFTGLPTQGNSLSFFTAGNKVFLSRLEGLYATNGPGQSWAVNFPEGVHAIPINDLSTDGSMALATGNTTVRQSFDQQGAWFPTNPANISDQVRLFGVQKIGSNYLLGVENVFGVLDVYHATSATGPWTPKEILDMPPNAKFLAKGDSLIIYGSLGGTPACFINDDQGDLITAFSTGLFGFSFDDYVPAITAHKGDLYALITGIFNPFSKLRKYDLPGGTFWSQVTERINGNFFGATALASLNDNLYLGMVEGGVKVSADDGVTWTDLSTGLDNAVANQLYAFDGFLAAATNKGVFLLEPGQTTWTNLSQNLPVSDIVKLQASDGYLWALAEYGGVWRLWRANGNVSVDPGQEKAVISLYPNPTSGTVSLESPFERGAMLEIVDVRGARLMVQSISGAGTHQVEIAHLPDGLYHLRLTGPDGKTATKTFMKHSQP
jgi:photosystem II stability/assembly factor-like uncharacterized protein